MMPAPLPKMTATDDQKKILKTYWKEKTMRSTRQHLLIYQCSLDTCLPIRYIKKWIGNQNAKGKGKRNPQKSSRAAGRPRSINGFNLFCRETRAPDNVRTGDRGTQSRWWTQEWHSLSNEERESFTQRARAVCKEVATETLEGDALEERRDFIMRQLSYWFVELDKARLDGLAIVVGRNPRPQFVSTSTGKEFAAARQRYVHNIAGHFQGFAEEAQDRNIAPTSVSSETVQSESPPPSSNPPRAGYDSDLATIQEHAPFEEGGEEVTGESDTNPKPAKPLRGRKRKSGQAPNSFAPGEALEGREENAGASKKDGREGDQQKKRKQNAKSSLKHGPAPVLTAQQILIPMANGMSPIQDPVDNRKVLKKTRKPSTKISQQKANKRELQVGQTVHQLWLMTGSKEKSKWFKGIVEKRDKTTYHIRFADKKTVTRIPYKDVYEALENKTLTVE